MVDPGVILKRFENPDETRHFEHGRLQRWHCDVPSICTNLTCEHLRNGRKLS